MQNRAKWIAAAVIVVLVVVCGIFFQRMIGSIMNVFKGIGDTPVYTEAELEEDMWTQPPYVYEVDESEYDVEQLVPESSISPEGTDEPMVDDSGEMTRVDMTAEELKNAPQETSAPQP